MVLILLVGKKPTAIGGNKVDTQRKEEMRDRILEIESSYFQ
jgi:hypothetical protein